MLIQSKIEKLPLKRCKAGVIEKHVKWNFWSDKLRKNNSNINKNIHSTLPKKIMTTNCKIETKH